MALQLPTIEVEAKISRDSIIQLVVGLTIVVVVGSLLYNVSKFSKKR